MEVNEFKLRLKLQDLTKLWESLLTSHTSLYELTCKEYHHLLSSELELLEKTIDEKQNVINHIAFLDEQRQELISEISKISNQNEEISKLSELTQYIKENFNENIGKQLEGYNNLLLEIIENIQEQNKKNQLFLNRAIISLQDLKESFQGKATFKVYNNKGMARKNANT